MIGLGGPPFWAPTAGITPYKCRRHCVGPGHVQLQAASRQRAIEPTASRPDSSGRSAAGRERVSHVRHDYHVCCEGAAREPSKLAVSEG
jgi:hypothetical protein